MPKAGKQAGKIGLAEVRERETKAVQLRQAGVTYDQIAKAVGFADESGAYKAVRRAIERRQYDAVDDLRAMELDRLDELHRSLWPKALNGNLHAVDRLLRVMQQRAKYIPGLEVPTAVDVTMTEVSPDEVNTFMAGAFAQYQCLKEGGV